MRNLIKLLAIFFFVSTIDSSVMAIHSKSSSELKRTCNGDILYTRFSLFYEYGIHNTTNYRRGIFLPVNTPVTFVSSAGNSIYITLPNGDEISIENNKKYSGESLEGIFKRTFSTSHTDLSKFTEEEQNAIKAGKVNIGMSKAAVLIAIGYPPKHKTPSLDDIYWRYWSSRYNSFLIEFENDKVVNIQN